MQEKAAIDGARITFDAPPRAGQCIRRAGNDFSRGEEVLEAGSLLGPAALSLAAAAGAADLSVFQRPTIAMLSTGFELVLLGQKPGPDQIIASNVYGLGALMAPWAEQIIDCGIAGDQPETLSAALKSAFERADLVVSFGGVSVGDHDHVRACFEGLGGKTGFWRVAMRPGKPVLFGTFGEKLFLGLPGNPVSALVTGRVLGLPLLRAMNGHANPKDQLLRLPLATTLGKNGGRQHYMRSLFTTGATGRTEIALVPETDSAHLNSFARATALIVQPPDGPALPAGDLIDVLPM
jgi:molybdopterin molybdotransferase